MKGCTRLGPVCKGELCLERVCSAQVSDQGKGIIHNVHQKAVAGWRVYEVTAWSDLEDSTSFFCECADQITG